MNERVEILTEDDDNKLTYVESFELINLASVSRPTFYLDKPGNHITYYIPIFRKLESLGYVNISRDGEYLRIDITDLGRTRVAMGQL